MSFVHGLHPADLPQFFRLYESIEFDPDSIQKPLHELEELLRRALG